MLEDFLVRACQESWVFCHRLIWYLRSEFKPPDEALNPEIKRSGWKPPADTGLWGLTERVHGRIYGMLSPKDAEFLDAEMKYFDKVTFLPWLNILPELLGILSIQDRKQRTVQACDICYLEVKLPKIFYLQNRSQAYLGY